MDLWHPWTITARGVYRWVESLDAPDFGQIWYNPESDTILLRQVTHKMTDRHDVQIMEKRDLGTGLVFIGEL